MEKVKIQICSGTYGHKENGVLMAKTPKNGSFLVEEKEANRLVALGVAVRISHESSVSSETNTDDGNDIEDGTNPESGADTDETNENTPDGENDVNPFLDMLKADLQALAKENNLTPPNTVKTQKEWAAFLFENLKDEEEDTETEESPDLSSASSTVVV